MQQSIRRHISYPDTPTFYNLYKEVLRNTDNNGRLIYANFDSSLGVPPTPEQIELLQSYQPTMPIIQFIGSEKLHGENMAVCFSQGELWVQSRNHIRTLLGDQNGMAAFVESTKQQWVQLSLHLCDLHNISLTTHTIVLDMEWAGANIQKGNAACSGTNKGTYLFDYFRVVNNATSEVQYIPTTINEPLHTHNIYLMRHFGTYTITLDFNQPTECEATLKQMAEEVEANSPIAAYFNKPDNVGEGVYLIGYNEGHMYRLKTKGEKHGGKPKEPRQPKSGAQLEQLQTIADKLTPVWRINQAITELNATELKHTGEVIKWVFADIVKEELPTLEEAKLTLKEVSNYVSKIVSTYYKDSLNSY